MFQTEPIFAYHLIQNYIMETKLVTVQPAVGGMIKASKDSFVIPKEELKDFHLKFAFP